MTVKIPQANLQIMKKEGEKMRGQSKESIRIARVTYGNRKLTECMGTVIHLHMNE